jgi:hypothetical protein
VLILNLAAVVEKLGKTRSTGSAMGPVKLGAHA